MQPSVDPQFNQLFHTAERCAFLVRNLRANLLHTHRAITSGLELDAEKDTLRIRIEKLANELTDEYERVENEAKLLPTQIPVSTMTNRLNNFLLDVSTNTVPQTAYANSRDAFDWADSTGNYINFACEFLKQTQTAVHRSRKICLSQVLPDRIPFVPTRAIPGENPHRRFEEFIRQFIQNQESRGLRYTYRYLERGSMSCILEVRLMSNPQANPREAPSTEPRPQPVCLLKFLLLVNNGSLEYIQFIAPHEDWSYTETNQVDLSVESRYELYKRLTTQGNIVVNMLIGSTQAMTSDVKNIGLFLGVVGRFHYLDQPCRQCKKILKDFSPTTVCDTKKLFYHLTCK